MHGVISLVWFVFTSSYDYVLAFMSVQLINTIIQHDLNARFAQSAK